MDRIVYLGQVPAEQNESPPGPHPPCLPPPPAAKLLTRDEARRIATNMAQLPGLLAKQKRPNTVQPLGEIAGTPRNLNVLATLPQYEARAFISVFRFLLGLLLLRHNSLPWCVGPLPDRTMAQSKFTPQSKTTRDGARRIAVNIAKVPEFLGAR